MEETALTIMANQEREYLLAEIASMYYEGKKKQAEIAKELNCSRSLVSMMLTEAQENGIVKIEINYPLPRAPKLELALKEKFGLQDVLVVNRGSLSYPRMLRLIGRLSAAYLSQHLPTKGILGIGWGTAVFEVVNSLRPQPHPNMRVVQLTGAMSGLGDALIDGPELARSLAMNYSAKYYTINAPAIVTDQRIRDALLKEKPVHEILDLVSQVNVAVIGIGTTDPEVSSMVRTGYLTVEDLCQIQAHGAVGDICGYHFDIEGNVLDLDINKRVIGIDLDVLKSENCKVIGVAGGEQKAQAILGALAGGFLKVLVTDNIAAERILNS